MKLLCLLVLLLALGLQDTIGQDAPADADADAPADAAADDGDKADGDECEESWDYIEFLRSEVSDKAEEILVDIRDKTKQGFDEIKSQNIIREALDKVLKIRGDINGRIFKIRKKEEVTICEDQNVDQENKLNNLRMSIMGILLKLVDKTTTPEELKEIGTSILGFRREVNQEIMRVLMLPQGGGPRVPTGDCGECDQLQELSDKVEGIIKCAKGEEAGDDDAADDADAGGDDAANADADAAADGEGACMPPAMLFMDIMEANRNIDVVTESMFQQLFSSMEDSKRTKLENTLTDLKDVRENMEEAIKKLARLENEDQIKRKVQQTLRAPSDKIKSLLEKCREDCGQSSCEDSCGFQELEKVKTLISNIKEDFQEDFDSTKEDARIKLMGYLSTSNGELNNVLGRKVENDGEYETKCDEEKEKAIGIVMNPMWMLVNATLFNEDSGQIIAIIDTLVVELDRTIETMFCTEGEPPIPVSEDCEADEYEQIGEYVDKIDTIIQENLFKSGDPRAKINAQLGFLEVKKLFDTRIAELFTSGVVCRGELEFVKKDLMVNLNKCMAEFMNNKKKFDDMTRLERIECTKELRGKMEDRRASLLRKQIEGIQAAQTSGDPQQ